MYVKMFFRSHLLINKSNFKLLYFSQSPGKIGQGLFRGLENLNGRDHQSSACTQQLPLPPPVDPAAEAFRLTEALRAVLESQGSVDDQGALRKQVTPETANVILKWLGINEVRVALFIQGIHTTVHY